MNRTSHATWRGDLRTGHGQLTSESGTLSRTPYTFDMRFENVTGTNPEELIASAHAGCFTMALSGELETIGFTATRLDTKATVTLDRKSNQWTITRVHLDVTGVVPGCNPAAFEKAATQAKANCPVSRLLNARITMNASLEAEKAAA